MYQDEYGSMNLSQQEAYQSQPQFSSSSTTGVLERPQATPDQGCISTT